MNRYKTQRAGVIPFTISNDMIYILMGIDRKTQDYSDFGGGVKRNEPKVIGAIREFKEESCMIFTEKEYNSCRSGKAVAITRDNMTIYFVYIDPIWFGKVNSSVPLNGEMSTFKWISWPTFCHLVTTRYSRVWHKIKWCLQESFNEKTFRKNLKSCARATLSS